MKRIFGTEQMQLSESIRRYLIFFRAQGASPRSLSSRCVLQSFERWAQTREVTTIEQLTPEIFFAYQEELPFRLTRYGRPITIATQSLHLSVLRAFGRYLMEQDFLISNPTRRIKLPRVPKPLPRIIPNQKEAIRLVTTRVGDDLLSYRDCTILEFFYSTGLRLSEVVNLHIGDIDLVGGYVWVREGKGRKDRVVPLGQTAMKSLTIYLDAVRPALLRGKEDIALFLNRHGKRLSGDAIYHLIKKAVAHAKLSPKISTHSLRHAAATHMLQNGAPIRHLQEFLGHASVDTTQVYTRVTIPELKAIHAKYHPREKKNNEE